MDVPKVPPRSALSELDVLLDSPEVGRLIAELEETRWTGRPGYPIRAMVGMALIKSMFAIPCWSRVAALVREHPGLQAVLGSAPSVFACYRFAAKLRTYGDKLGACVARVLASLHAEHPDMGRDVAIDASDLPAYANGQRFVSKGGRERSDDEFSDPDASWGHRSAVSTRKGGGYYGYKVDMAVCTRTGLRLAWQTRTARANESLFAAPLIDAVRAQGFAAESCALDKGYDLETIYVALEDRDCRPIMPLRQTTGVKAGRQAADVRARRVAIRGNGLHPQGVQVALPDRRVHAREPVGQGQPSPPADPARDFPLAQALQGPCLRGAGIRAAQE